MFERFTDRARRVLVLAQNDARESGHACITPGHVLVALTEEGEGLAATAMRGAGVDFGGLRERVASSAASDPTMSGADQLPFSREAKKVLELSLREALQLGHDYIGTEHVLLGVLRWGRTERSLEGLLGMPVSSVRSALMGLVTGSARPGVSPAVAAAIERARKVAGTDQVTSGQLLIALLEDAESQATKMLDAIGISRNAAGEALERTPVSGTSDEAPRVESIDVKVGDVSLAVKDADLVAKLRGARPHDILNALRRHFDRGDSNEPI